MLGFRVWYCGHMMKVKNSKVVMNSEGELCEIYEGGPCPYPINSGLYPSAPIPMQSTGVCDFRGKEIFVGDMLFFKFSDAPIDSFYYLVEDVGYFNQQLGIFVGKQLSVKISNDGNIYECPALLERLNDQRD